MTERGLQLSFYLGNNPINVIKVRSSEHRPVMALRRDWQSNSSTLDH